MRGFKNHKPKLSVAKQVTLSNPRSGELWLCDDYNTRRKIDGNEFVEVHKPQYPRRVWININTVTVKKPR